MKAWTIGGQTGIAAPTPAICRAPIPEPGKVAGRVGQMLIEVAP